VAATSCSASLFVSADNAGDAERAGAHRNRDSAAARILRIALALLVVFAAVAFADDTDDAAKLKAFRDLNPQTSGHNAVPGKRVEWHSTYVDLHYFGMDWRILYLPFLAPLPGASLKDAGTIPNAFEQLGVPYASTMPPAFAHDRSAGVEKEYKRIEKLSKQAQVVVTSTSDGSH